MFHTYIYMCVCVCVSVWWNSSVIKYSSLTHLIPFSSVRETNNRNSRTRNTHRGADFACEKGKKGQNLSSQERRDDSPQSRNPVRRRTALRRRRRSRPLSVLPAPSSTELRAARQDLALLHRKVGWATGGGSARRRPCCCAVIGRSGWLFCSLVLSVDDICKTVPRWVWVVWLGHATVFFYDKRGRYGGSRSTVQMRGMGCKLPTQLAYCISYSPFGEENRDHFLSRRKEKKIMVKTSLIKISIFRLYS
jgi:hypothetical protein